MPVVRLWIVEANVEALEPAEVPEPVAAVVRCGAEYRAVGDAQPPERARQRGELQCRYLLTAVEPQPL